jgi:MFS family permease
MTNPSALETPYVSQPSQAQPLPVSQDESLSTSASKQAASYNWFITGVATWFIAAGMQGVLFSWLVVGVLQASAEWVGITQSAMMLPSVVLLFVGGAVADRHDRRNLLIGLHLSATVLSVSLFLIVMSDSLSLPLLIAYALGMGSVQAFVMPARDSLLSEVAGKNLLRAVTGMNIAQWGTQAIGSLVAGGARWVGTGPALGLHALTLLSGVAALNKLPPAPPHSEATQHPLRLADVMAGMREVLGSQIMRPVFLLVNAVGTLFIGPFVVVFPILVRDYYGGDIGQLALLNMAFPVGTILGSLVMLWRGRLRRKGIAQMVTLTSGAFCLIIIAQGLPLWGTLLAVVVWGMGAAVFVNAGRTVFQEQALPSHRARVFAAYSFGFMGAAGLLGAPLSGIIVKQVGPLTMCAIAGTAMLVVVICMVLFTGIRRVE